MTLISPVFYPRWLKPALFTACLAPLAWLAARALGAGGGLGANPIEAATRYLGDWALAFLLIALAVTPLRRLTGWAAATRLRRMLGLFAFAYASLHVLSYLGLDLFFDVAAFAADLVKRRYITVGMIAFAILLALAATSPQAMIRRLGGRWWKRLHRLVYPAAILGVLHHFWMVKAGFAQPLAFAAVLALLLGLRLAWVAARLYQPFSPGGPRPGKIVGPPPR